MLTMGLLLSYEKNKVSFVFMKLMAGPGEKALREASQPQFQSLFLAPNQESIPELQWVKQRREEGRRV